MAGRDIPQTSFCFAVSHCQAPEVIRGEPATKAIDAHSFGTILWEVRIL